VLVLGDDFGWPDHDDRVELQALGLLRADQVDRRVELALLGVAPRGTLGIEHGLDIGPAPRRADQADEAAGGRVLDGERHRFPSLTASHARSVEIATFTENPARSVLQQMPHPTSGGHLVVRTLRQMSMHLSTATNSGDRPPGVHGTFAVLWCRTPCGVPKVDRLDCGLA
jgi:hypothetical protein